MRSTLRRMSANRDRYLRAIAGFGATVDAVDPSRWDAPSPCTDWTARDVAGHVIAIQHSIIATIVGERSPMNPMKDPGRHAGADPVAAWRAAVAAIVAAVGDDDVLHRIVTTWRGDVTVDEMLGYNVGDTTIHTWDLARAGGVDDHLDPDLVQAVLALYTPMADVIAGTQMFGERLDVPSDADPQTRLLAMVGRRT
ncbi:MAG: hypothetical protein JWL72_3469 [Ilumatobacteraceae bacterium]|nr:hypothetical protein [Ilumatobacteraceae bacterium]